MGAFLYLEWGGGNLGVALSSNTICRFMSYAKRIGSD